MRKTLLVFSLLVALAAPAMAAPRDDDARGPRGIADRIVLWLRHLFVVPFDDGGETGPPKP